MDAKTGDLVSSEPGPQAKRAMENLQAIAVANGFKMDDIVKALVFVTDMKNQPDVNEEYRKFFKGDLPARSCVAVH